MANGGPSTVQSGAGGAKPTPVVQSEAVQNKRDLAGWWKQFKRSDKKPQEMAAPPPQGIFGIPLQTSVRYANVAISLFNDDGQSYIYGYVPIIVAKCGVFLKEKATDVEGIFRLAGSEKRIKELKVSFDSPDRYGKGLDWTGYTVHDAANILRRYFNQLPEPIIPLGFYERFRDPLRNHQAQAVGHMDAQSPTVGEFDQEEAIRAYQSLITEIPPLNRQLLLYILDLLAVFASKSDMNKMTTPNLSAIFQPGILSHPQHDMAPQEYRLSQDVLIFLIENQDSFLIGMPGTAADHETVKDVQSGAHSPGRSPSTPTTPSRSKTVLGRSTSNASGNAESRWSSLRRNVSVSSKQSKRSESGPVPVVTGPHTPGSSSVHRSNTVPSRRTGTGSAAQSPRFSRVDVSEPSTPSHIAAPVPAAATAAAISAAAAAAAVASAPVAAETPRQSSLQSTPVASTAPIFPPVAPIEVTSASSSEVTTPLAGGVIGSDTSSTVTRDYPTAKKDTTPLLGTRHGTADTITDRSVSNTPSASSTRGFLDIFKQSPTSESDGRKPNKLQKKRIPGSALSSAQSSSQSLQQHDDETMQQPMSPRSIVSTEAGGEGDQITAFTPSAGRTHMAPQRNPTDATIRRNPSPTRSARSHTSVTDQSDADLAGDDMPTQAYEAGAEKQKRKHRWRFSRTQNKLEPGSTHSGSALGEISAKEVGASRSTIGSGTGSGSQARRSFQEQHGASTATGADVGGVAAAGSLQAGHGGQQFGTDSSVFSDSERERKGPMSWIRSKIHERREKEAEKRSHTPERKSEAQHTGAGESAAVRGASIDASRQVSGAGAVPTENATAGIPGAPPRSSGVSDGLAANGAGQRVTSDEVAARKAIEPTAQDVAATTTTTDAGIVASSKTE